ncbi:MAG: RNA polymerase subunit sigma-24 [Acidobacteriota bacterium]
MLPEVRKIRQQHIFWIINNHPNSPIAGLPQAIIDKNHEKEAYEQAKILWLKHVENNKDDIAITGNAAKFFFKDDQLLAADLLAKMEQLDPKNVEWYNLLGIIYFGGTMVGPPDARKESAIKAVKEFEKALNIVSDDERYTLLGDLAKASLAAGQDQEARNYSLELLERASNNRNSALKWNYGNAIHDSNTILGRLALRAGDLETAKQHLIKSGATPGSPQLNTFGPNMILAKELLERGEQKTTLQYLELCANFWELGSERLKNWQAIIKNGNIPDFGINLYF